MPLDVGQRGAPVGKKVDAGCRRARSIDHPGAVRVGDVGRPSRPYGSSHHRPWRWAGCGGHPDAALAWRERSLEPPDLKVVVRCGAGGASTRCGCLAGVGGSASALPGGERSCRACGAPQAKLRFRRGWQRQVEWLMRTWRRRRTSSGFRPGCAWRPRPRFWTGWSLTRARWRMWRIAWGGTCRRPTCSGGRTRRRRATLRSRCCRWRGMSGLGRWTGCCGLWWRRRPRGAGVGARRRDGWRRRGRRCVWRGP